MKLVYSTQTKTSTTGTWSGGQNVMVENTGAAAATVAGKTIAAMETITFTAQQDDQIEFAYDCSSTTLEITVGLRKMS